MIFYFLMIPLKKKENNNNKSHMVVIHNILDFLNFPKISFWPLAYVL